MNLLTDLPLLLHTAVQTSGLGGVGGSLVLELAILAAIILAVQTLEWAVGRYLKLHLDPWLFAKASPLLWPFGIGLLAWILAQFLSNILVGGHILNGTALLMVFWLVVRVTHMLPGPRSIKLAFIILTGLLLTLMSVNSLRPLLDNLNDIQLVLGGLKITALGIVEAVVLLGMFGWLSVASANGLEQMLGRREDISLATQSLLLKLFKLFTLTFGVLLALTVAGVNVAHLAVFGGAIGLGLGLSLKSISSNFVSGLFLLMDKSIKPGDVISLDDMTFGQVKALNSRYVVLRRRDGKEVLIPNEMLMNQPVINWSYTNKAVRAEVEIPVPYGSDMEQVQEILREAVKTVPRVVAVPAPIIFIRQFGENSVIWWVRFWSTDPEAGVNNLKGEVNMACWKALRDNNIEMPLPQRVLHMAEPEKLKKSKA